MLTHLFNTLQGEERLKAPFRHTHCANKGSGPFLLPSYSLIIHLLHQASTPNLCIPTLPFFSLEYLLVPLQSTLGSWSVFSFAEPHTLLLDCCEFPYDICATGEQFLQVMAEEQRNRP